MALSDMKVFDSFVVSSMTETVRQQVDLFNAASNGTLVMSADRNIGDYSKESYWAEISGVVRRRNIAGSGSVSPVALSQLQHNAVKVAAGTPPLAWNPSQLSWMQKNQEEAGTVIGAQLAVAKMQDMLNTAVTAAVAAMTNVGATVVFDGTASTLTHNSLNKGAFLFGDRSNDIRAWFIHSKAMRDLIDAGLTNTAQLFSYGTINIIADPMGRRFIMTDSASLIQDVTTDKYYTLGLVQGGIVCEDNGDFYSNQETSNGSDNITTTWQAEWTYQLGLKGYAWDISNGGRSPTNAAIGTGTNWDKIATDVKSTAGVLVKSL